VTRLAAADGLAEDGSAVYLGVFADNRDAIGVYGRSGFVQVGTPAADMLLW
jgi:ribosomal protein S18 acetylase RimI-like enzyme